MKILLKGYYGFGNLGDDVLMKVTWEIVKEKYPNASFYIHSNFNENLRGFSQTSNYNDYIYNILDRKVTIIDWTAVTDFDLVVDGGGGVYFDYTQGSFLTTIINKFSQWIGTKKLYRLDKVLRRIVGKRRRLNFKKRIGIGLGIGPYSDQSNLFYQHLVEIGSTDTFFVRDNTSLALLHTFGHYGNKFLCSDLAFYSDHWLDPALIAIPDSRFGGNVGIILLDWHVGNVDRFSEVNAFAETVKAAGNKVTFFSFDENHDKAYIKEFQSKFDFVLWQPNKMRLNDFLKILAAQNILFSARAHGVIIGSILGVPTVCLGTSKKLEEVHKMFPRSSSLVQEPVTSKALCNQLEKMQKMYDKLHEHLSDDIHENKILAAKTLEKLNTYL